MKIIKKYLGEFMTITGTGIFAYNILNFSFTDKELGLINLPGGQRDWVYFYKNEVLLCIAIGAMLIVAGILIIKNKSRK